MTLRQMEYFIAVVEYASFSVAAEQMNVSQPGLSQQIQQLEREVGAPLLDRTPRTVHLTAAGRAYIPHAKSALRDAKRASRAVRNSVLGLQGDLELATVTSIAAGILPGAFSRWRERFPGVPVRLHEYGHCHALETDIQAGVADFAIGPRPISWHGPVISLGVEEYVVVLPHSDPLSGASVVDIKDLADRNWVQFPKDHDLREISDSICVSAGFAPVGLVETTQLETGARLAAAGFGPIILPEYFVSLNIPAAVLRMKEPHSRELAAYARTDFSSMAEAFIDTIRLTPTS
ncbi:MAG: putative LysR family transcriptional regulator [Pseudonocardiales bacterium]|nr:putative LysR family transcriptional regulator [Pseudonocardiales bacterium]